MFSTAGFATIDSGSRVLIAGASGGIGGEVARLFAERGAIVGAHYFRNVAKLAQLAPRDRSRLRLFGTDLTTAMRCERLVDDFVAWAGGIDILVQLTGGVARAVGWEELTEEEWKSDLDINLNGPFFLARAAMRRMSNGATVILTSTASARHGGGRTTLAYGVAKAAIECLVKGLARDGASRGIRVNAICPGFIDTELQLVLKGSAAALRERAQLVPMQRAGTATEVANAILFLASSAASYITGECLTVSGGDWL